MYSTSDALTIAAPIALASGCARIPARTARSRSDGAERHPTAASRGARALARVDGPGEGDGDVVAARRERRSLV